MEMAAEHIAFCDKHMPGFLETRKIQGDEAALEELERIYKLAEQQFDNARFFYRVVWFEAQARSGKQDEAWGQKLYEYLFERDVVNNPNRTSSCQLQPGDYILCGNIASSCVVQGKAARAREYYLKIEDSLLADLKFDLSGASYADQGPIFSFLGDARNRNYPIFIRDLNPADTNPNNRKLIHYANIYALDRLASNSSCSGDWVKAAELSAWCIRYADEVMKTDHIMREEIVTVASYVPHKRLADLAVLHGYRDEAARFLREFIMKAEGYYETGEWNVLSAKLDLALVRIELGEITQEDLALADRAEKAISGNWWNGRATVNSGKLKKARVYHALGHSKEAWEMVDQLMAQAKQDVNPHHWLGMLNTAIDLALADGAVRPELEEWLVLALDNARRTGNKFRELPLYEKYARFLMIKGRYSEAVQIQLEAVRLANAMNLPKRHEDNLAALADMNRTWEAQNIVQTTDEPTTADDSPETTETASVADVPETTRTESVTIAGSVAVPTVDIQPRFSHSATLQGRAAYGRFYLHNPSGTSAQGQIQLHGPIDQTVWQNDQWLTVSASPAFENVRLSRSLTLDAGETCIVDITGLPLDDGNRTSLECRWVAEGQAQVSVEGIWSYETSETEKRTAVIDAHELQDNPFYLIPIHHMVQRLDTTDRQIIDFSVTASSPTRIECYDAASGHLLSVDANGDGDFLDAGDLIAGDNNRNSWPDLVFEPDQKLSSLVMYVQQSDAASTADTELTISTRTDGDWQIDAVDVIKPASPSD